MGRNAQPSSSTIAPSSTALVARIVSLEARVARLETTRARQRVGADERLLDAIAAATKGHTFNANELRAHVDVDATLARVLGPMTVKQIGQQLRRLQDRPLSGLVLRRLGRDEHGCIWIVELHPDAGRATADGR
jgi:hypothetical protein